MQAFLHQTSALEDILALALREPIVRIKPFLGPNGERLWLKRIEALSLRLRLQKGDSRRAFANELKALHVLSKAGLPVPEILAEGPDHFVVADVGPTLAQLLRRSAMPFAKRAAAFRAAGAAMARLHMAGFAHGRPAIRVICWDGDEARFIDLEQFSDHRRSARNRAMDLVIFAQTYIAETGSAGPCLDAAFDAYRTTASAGALQNVRRLAFWLSPLVPLTAPLRWLRPSAKDFKALPQTLAYLRNQVV